MRDTTFFGTDDIVKSERCLHTPSAFARNNLLYVQEVGYSESKQPHRCVREKLDSFLFFVVTEGKGSIEIDDEHYEMEKGYCAFINCMKHFEHISSEKDPWKLAWVHFNGEIAMPYYDLFMSNNKCNVFHSGNVDKWSAYIDRLIEKQSDKSFSAELQSGEVLLSLLNFIVTTIFDFELEEKELANEIRIVLNDMYNRQDITDVLIKDFKKDAAELDAIFVKYYGINIKEYIEKRKFNVAKQLLRFSIKPIEEVLSESGIDNYQDMQRQFMGEEGMTAEEYRRRWAQWIRQ